MLCLMHYKLFSKMKDFYLNSIIFTFEKIRIGKEINYSNKYSKLF